MNGDYQPGLADRRLSGPLPIVGRNKSSVWTLRPIACGNLE